MASAKVVLTLFFMLTLGAGLVAGLLVARPLVVQGAATRPVARTPLGAELGLTPEQSARMHDIWEGVRDEVDGCFRRAQEAQQRRDAALVALLTDEQKVAFARAQEEYGSAVKLLKAQRDAAFAEAVRRTEAMLDASQRKRYREILQSRLGQDSGKGTPDWMGAHEGSATSASGAEHRTGKE